MQPSRPIVLRENERWFFHTSVHDTYCVQDSTVQGTPSSAVLLFRQKGLSNSAQFARCRFIDSCGSAPSCSPIALSMNPGENTSECMNVPRHGQTFLSSVVACSMFGQPCSSTAVCRPHLRTAAPPSRHRERQLHFLRGRRFRRTTVVVGNRWIHGRLGN